MTNLEVCQLREWDNSCPVWKFEHDEASCGLEWDHAGDGVILNHPELPEPPLLGAPPIPPPRKPIPKPRTQFPALWTPGPSDDEDDDDRPVPLPRCHIAPPGSIPTGNGGFYPFPPPRQKKFVVDSHTDEEFDEYMRTRLNEESFEESGDSGCEDTAPLEQLAKPKKRRPFLNWFRKDRTEVTLGMWHSKWETRSKAGLRAPPILSDVYPEERWELVKTPAGDMMCSLVRLPVNRPELGGPSQKQPGMAYSSDEVRPHKQLRLSSFMDITALAYVDVELFTVLKATTMATGVVAATHAKLHRQADAFLTKYRVNLIHPVLMLEVKHWTVLAAMIPTSSEMRGLALMAKPKLYKAMNQATEFKRDGTVVKKRFFLPNVNLSLFKTKTA